MPPETYDVRMVVEPGTAIDRDGMGRHELAALLEGTARRLLASPLTEITLLSVMPSEPVR